MLRVALIAAGVAGAGYLLLRGTSSAGRRITKADYPKLRAIYFTKVDLGRDLALCINRANSGSLLSGTQTAGAIAGLFAGAVTLDFNKAIKIAKGTTDTLEALGLGRHRNCDAAVKKLKDDVAYIEQLSAELGIPVDLTPEQVKVLMNEAGHDEFAAAEREATYQRCVKAHGAARCSRTNQETSRTSIGFAGIKASDLK